MADFVPEFEVRRVPVPYFRPFVVIEVQTNTICAHYDTERQARAGLEMFKAGLRLFQPSVIQPGNDPIKVAEARMRHPFGEPRAPISNLPARGGRRSVEL